MVIEKEFFEAIRNGDYYSMPKTLRELCILVVNNQDRPALIVNRYVRPTLLEDAIYKYNLQGITVTMITDVKKAAAIFTRFYTITIDIPAFLSNLSIFYRTSGKQLEQRYGHTAETLEAVFAKRQGIRRKTNDLNKEPKDPREKEILLFWRKIKEEKKS